MKDKYSALISAILLLAATQGAIAGGSEGLVTYPLVHEGDIFMFSAGNHGNKPVCATSTFNTWAVKLSTEKGRAMMALVMAAHAQGKRVHVQGFATPHCNDWGDREAPLYAVIVD